jgi:hypothetical protein
MTCFHCGAEADIAEVICLDCVNDLAMHRMVFALHRFPKPEEELPPRAEWRPSRTSNDWQPWDGKTYARGLVRVPVRMAGHGMRWTDPEERGPETVPIYATFPAHCVDHSFVGMEDDAQVCKVCGMVQGEHVALDPNDSKVIYQDLDFPFIQQPGNVVARAAVDEMMLDATQTRWAEDHTKGVIADLYKRHKHLKEHAPDDMIARQALRHEIEAVAPIHVDPMVSPDALQTAMTAVQPWRTVGVEGAVRGERIPRALSPGEPICAEHLVRGRDKQFYAIPKMLVGRIVPRHIDGLQWVLTGWIVSFVEADRARFGALPELSDNDVETAWSELMAGRIVAPPLVCSYATLEEALSVLSERLQAGETDLRIRQDGYRWIVG